MRVHTFSAEFSENSLDINMHPSPPSILRIRTNPLRLFVCPFPPMDGLLMVKGSKNPHRSSVRQIPSMVGLLRLRGRVQTVQ